MIKKIDFGYDVNKKTNQINNLNKAQTEAKHVDDRNRNSKSPILG